MKNGKLQNVTSTPRPTEKRLTTLFTEANVALSTDPASRRTPDPILYPVHIWRRPSESIRAVRFLRVFVICQAGCQPQVEAKLRRWSDSVARKHYSERHVPPWQPDN